MGSPYFVHKQANRVHVVRSYRGFNKLLDTICHTFEDGRTLDIVSQDYCSPEWRVLHDLYSSFRDAWLTNSRQVVFLEARYEWSGWEKFQRIIVFDFSGSCNRDPLPDEFFARFGFALFDY